MDLPKTEEFISAWKAKYLTIWRLTATSASNLVNFAFLDEEIFRRCLFELFSYYAVTKAQKRSAEFIYELLTGYIVGLLPKSPYYYLFLLSYVEFLLDGEIDPRVITGVTPDDRALLKMAAAEVKDGVSDTTKSSMMNIFIRCFDFKRTLTGGKR